MSKVRERVRSAADERIARLEAELDEARRDIVDLAPAELWDVLHGYITCGSREEHHRWRLDLVAAVIDRAVPDPATLSWQPRALCPLCRGGSSSPHQGGFTLPEGLRRHLEGFGNVRQCPVTRAAFRLARDYLRDRFLEAEEAARRLEEGRRSAERLYLVEPWSAPKLLEQHLPWGRAPRSQQDLEAAERRLADFGFRTEADGSVISYRLVHEGCVVFADPRAEGRIDFVASREDAQNPMADHEHFYLLDNWKDASGKFARRLAGAVEALASRKRRGPRGG